MQCTQQVRSVSICTFVPVKNVKPVVAQQLRARPRVSLTQQVRSVRICAFVPVQASKLNSRSTPIAALERVEPAYILSDSRDVRFKAPVVREHDGLHLLQEPSGVSICAHVLVTQVKSVPAAFSAAGQEPSGERSGVSIGTHVLGKQVE
jgi:hypothetical protein